MTGPDYVIMNGNIRTMDRSGRICTAMAVKNGLIEAAGTDEEVLNGAPAGTRIIDAEGMTIVPGFNDAHCHLLSLRGKQLLQVDCSPAKARSIEDIITLLREKASRTPKGEWVLGGSYDYAKLAEKRHPTRWELDRVSTEHPVHLRSQTCHSGVVNTRALEISGIDSSTPDPDGGEFARNSDGQITGLCFEEAHFLFVTGMGREGSFVPSYSTAELVKAVSLACDEAAAYGITSVGDGLVGPPEIEAFQEARSSGSLRCRVYMNILDSYFPRLKATGIKTGFGDEMLKIGAVKHFVDGAIAAHTAWVSEPYRNRPNYYGIPTRSAEETEELVREAHGYGCQMEIHANGDRAIDMVLTAFEKAQASRPAPPMRHRIAHCTVVNPELVERIRLAGVIPLPFTTYVWEHGEKMDAYGDRIEMMFAHKSFLDAGIPVAASSDNPCGTQDVMTALQAMVTRVSSEGLPIGLSQRISAEKALWIYTMGGAYATFEENRKGSLEPGKLADFTLLDKDPAAVDPFSIRDIAVMKTYLGGREVFSR